MLVAAGLHCLQKHSCTLANTMHAFNPLSPITFLFLTVVYPHLLVLVLCVPPTAATSSAALHAFSPVAAIERHCRWKAAGRAPAAAAVTKSFLGNQPCVVRTPQGAATSLRGAAWLTPGQFSLKCRKNFSGCQGFMHCVRQLHGYGSHQPNSWTNIVF